MSGVVDYPAGASPLGSVEQHPDVLDRENEKNRHQRPNGEAPDDSLAELLSSYTPKQRWSLLKGFRILAKVAVRAHMERQVPGSKTAPNGGGEEED